MFLSEPQLFLCDTSLALACLKPSYCHHLNGEDALLPDLALDQRRAWGGTLAMWHSSLDPFVSILPTTSSSVLPLLLSVPGLTSSLHIGLYLPTSGKEAEFTLALTALDMVLQDIAESHPSTPLYIRGDWVQEPPTPSWTCSCTAASPPSPSPW